MADDMNLVDPRTPEEKRERLIRDIYALAGAYKPIEAQEKIREILLNHLGPPGSVMTESLSWSWICEFCYQLVLRGPLPPGWDLVYQSAVCPECWARVQQDGGIAVVKGGAYAQGPDPRSKFRPTHQHYKGGLYEYLYSAYDATNSRSGSRSAVYRDVTGSVYVRDHWEFSGPIDHEGAPRFRPLPLAGDELAGVIRAKALEIRPEAERLLPQPKEGQPIIVDDDLPYCNVMGHPPVEGQQPGMHVMFEGANG